MELLNEFISTYGTTILYSVLTAIAGYLGIVVKNLYTKYINEVGEFEEEPDGENWLYFFRTNLVMNISVITDDDGNIADFDEYKSSGNRVAATKPDKLAAYGDVIYSIKRDTTNRTITFVYYIGAHLSATKEPNASSIMWKNFVYKDGGVKYTETYSYEEGGEIYYKIGVLLLFLK